MWNRILLVATLCVAALAVPIAHAQTADPASLTHTDLIKRGDTVLWLGDDVLQDADWPLFVEAALLAARPDDAVTWYRAGDQGSSAEAAALWGSRIVMTVRASLVFACFGQVESQFLRHPMPPGFAEPSEEDIELALQEYEAGLDMLIDALLTRGVRTVVVVSPPAVDEIEPNSHGFYVGLNSTLAHVADRARAVADRRGLPFLDLFAISNSINNAAHAAGISSTLDGRRPTEVGSTVIAADILAALGVDRDALGRRQWRPSSSPVYRTADEIDPTLPSYAEGDGSGSFAVAQALRTFDTHFLILWRDLDRNLNPDHASRADILSKHRAEVDADWRRVRDVVNENRIVKPEQP